MRSNARKVYRDGGGGGAGGLAKFPACRRANSSWFSWLAVLPVNCVPPFIAILPCVAWRACRRRLTAHWSISRLGRSGQGRRSRAGILDDTAVVPGEPATSAARLAARRQIVVILPASGPCAGQRNKSLQTGRGCSTPGWKRDCPFVRKACHPFRSQALIDSTDPLFSTHAE